MNKELKEDNIISVDQHEFMENRSCQANLMAFIDEITSLDDNGNCVGLKSLDFWASFWWPLN